MLQDLGTTEVTPHSASAQASANHVWFTSPELGHPLQDDNNDRPLHPLIGPYLREHLSGSGDIDDDDDEMGHLHVSGQHDSRFLAWDMLDSWDVLVISPNPNSPTER